MNDQLSTPIAQPAAIDPQDAMSLMVAADARRNRAIARQRTAVDVYNAALSEVNASTEDLETSQEAYAQAQLALLQSINRSNGGDVDFTAPAVLDAPQAGEPSAMEIQHAASQVIAQTAASIATSEAEAACI